MPKPSKSMNTTSQTINFALYRQCVEDVFGERGALAPCSASDVSFMT